MGNINLGGSKHFSQGEGLAAVLGVCVMSARQLKPITITKLIQMLIREGSH